MTLPTSTPPRQKILGSKGLIVLIALLSAFVPLSTDLYLPALPGMSRQFQVPVSQVNLTLSVFFVCYSLGILVWGPLSDRFGRKPVLIVGLSAYILASALCATAMDINALILLRALQAAGGSVAGAVATAIVKDVYTGRRREAVLALVQSLTMIVPAVAPALGAVLLELTSWRGVFWVLGSFGIMALLTTLAYEETIPARTSGPVFRSLGRLGAVLQNRGFAMLLLLFGLTPFSSLAFVASSTHIYQTGFGLSSQVYSFYFFLNALGLISGPMLYLRLARRFHSEDILRGCFASIGAGGVLVMLLGNLQPWTFAVCLLPASIANACQRSPAANLLLEQQKGDSGSVSSLMGCISMLMGSLGMTVISLNWPNTIIALGAITFTTAVLSSLLFPLVIRHAVRFPRPGAVPLTPGSRG